MLDALPQLLRLPGDAAIVTSYLGRWSPAPMQQIAEWLDDIGLSEYSQRFAENGIDISVLPDLTDQDLRVCPERSCWIA